MKKALFWDFDGTLIHPNESFLDALSLALQQVGCQVPREQVRAFLRTACSWYRPEIAYPDSTGPKWWETLFGRFHRFYQEHQLDRAAWETADRLFYNQILDPGFYTLYEDAQEVLTQCRELGYENYILSNNYPELFSVAQKLGLSQCFTGCIVSSKVGYEKPRGELFSCALETAGCPEFCCMIGDNPVADIQGGRAAGMKTILVHGQDKTAGDAVCETLSAIPKLLSAWELSHVTQ